MRFNHIGVPTIKRFVVDDLETELQGRNVIIKLNSPSPGLMVAFIEQDGAPVKLMQIDGAAAGNSI